MKFFKKFMVSIDFSTQISINSLASGGFAPEPPTNAYVQNFLNLYPHFRQKFEKILKKILKKSRNFLEIFKNCNFSFIFYKFFENFSGVRGAPPLGTSHAATPLQALHWWTSLPPPEKFPRALM